MVESLKISYCAMICSKEHSDALLSYPTLCFTRVFPEPIWNMSGAGIVGSAATGNYCHGFVDAFVVRMDEISETGFRCSVNG